MYPDQGMSLVSLSLMLTAKLKSSFVSNICQNINVNVNASCLDGWHTLRVSVTVAKGKAVHDSCSGIISIGKDTISSFSLTTITLAITQEWPRHSNTLLVKV